MNAGLTIAESKLEAEILKISPSMTAVMSAYLADAGTAALRGFAESFIGPLSVGGIRDQALGISSNQTFNADGSLEGAFTSATNALSRDSLNVLSFGYAGRDQSVLGEVSYMHTLTSVFTPQTPELLRQQI